MSRELKRVALNFNWPLKKKWIGYINPYKKQGLQKCDACEGTGYSALARHLTDIWFGQTAFRPEDRGSVPFLTSHPRIQEIAKRNISGVRNLPEARKTEALEREAQRLADIFNAQWEHHLNADDVAVLVEHSRLLELTHTWTAEHKWQPKDPFVIPTPEEVNLWSITGMGHDLINQCCVIEAVCKKAGFSVYCSSCNGEGERWVSEELKTASENWQPTEPPTGEGYQMWESVSEGSPISPVLTTPESLALWLSERTDESFSTWMRFILGPGWAPSMLNGKTGVEFLCGQGTLRI